jgi:hypothetical protein
VQVDEAGRDERAAGVDRSLARQAGTDLGDDAAVDRDVGDERFATAAVHDRAPTHDHFVHRVPLPL